MLSTDQNHIDSEINGGCNPIDSELINLRPCMASTIINAHQLQHQSPHLNIDSTKQQMSNAKKSVMLNLKSGAINSTVEEFEHYSTRFSDTFTQTQRRCQLWFFIIGIALACLGGFVFGLSFTHLFDMRSCDGK